MSLDVKDPTTPKRSSFFPGWSNSVNFQQIVVCLDVFCDTSMNFVKFRERLSKSARKTIALTEHLQTFEIFPATFANFIDDIFVTL